MKSFKFIFFVLFLSINSYAQINNDVAFKEIPNIFNNVNDQNYTKILNEKAPIYAVLKSYPSEIKKDTKGNSYQKTTIIFGFKNDENVFQIEQPFYINTKGLKNPLNIAYIHNSIYVLFGALNEKNELEYLLFKMNEYNKLSSANLNKEKNSNNQNFMSADSKEPFFAISEDKNNYSILDTDFDSKGEKFSNYLLIVFLQKNNINKIVLGRHSFQNTQLNILEIFHGENKNNMFEKWDKESVVFSEYTTPLIAEFKKRIFNPIENFNQKIIQLKNNKLKDETDGYTRLNDNMATKTGFTSGRGTTPLYIAIKKDYNDYKTCANCLKYFKTKIRFGFEDEDIEYELPGTYYTYNNTTFDNPLNERIPSQNVQMMYTNNKFVFFLNDYTNPAYKKGLLITFDPENGIKEETIFENSVLGQLAFFMRDENNDVALFHCDYDINAKKFDKYYKTVLLPTQYITTMVKGSMYSKDAINLFKNNVINPVYFINDILPYKPRNIYGDVGIMYKGIYTNDENSLKLYEKLKTKNQTLDKNGNFVKEDYTTYSEFLDDVTINNFFFFNPNITFYQPIKRKQLVIPFLPEVKSQNPFTFCVMYGVGAMIKQFINRDDNFRFLRESNPTALQDETDISYFALSSVLKGTRKSNQIDKTKEWMLTEAEKKWTDFTVDENKLYPDWEDWEKDDVSSKINRKLNDLSSVELILNTPQTNFDNIGDHVDNYYMKLGVKTSIQDAFFKDYLKNIYEKNKKTPIKNEEIENITNEIASMIGFDKQSIDLPSALDSPSLYEFYFKLFFKNAYQYSIKLPNISFKRLNSYISANATFDGNIVKKTLIHALEKGYLIEIGAKVILPGNEKGGGHALTICGYRIVKDPATGKLIDAFKILNSWGQTWQDITNDGWLNANDVINMMLIDCDNKFFDARVIPNITAFDVKFLEGKKEYNQYKKENSITVGSSSLLKAGDMVPIIPTDVNSGDINGYELKKIIASSGSLNDKAEEVQKVLSGLPILKFIKKDSSNSNFIDLIYKYKRNTEVWVAVRIFQENANASIGLWIKPFDDLGNVKIEEKLKVFEDLKRSFNYNQIKGEAFEKRSAPLENGKMDLKNIDNFGIIIQVKNK